MRKSYWRQVRKIFIILTCIYLILLLCFVPFLMTDEALSAIVFGLMKVYILVSSFPTILINVNWHFTNAADGSVVFLVINGFIQANLLVLISRLVQRLAKRKSNV